jgi:NADP-reducing hydrogenase subunit HndB
MTSQTKNMQKIHTLDDLLKIRTQVLARWGTAETGDFSDTPVQIKVGMATCGIASGAREIMNFFKEETEHQAIDAVITQTGCLGFCYAEPTVEVIVPGKEPLVFGHVDKARARQIIDKYIIEGELVDGIIPIPFNSIDK